MYARLGGVSTELHVDRIIAFDRQHASNRWTVENWSRGQMSISGPDLD